MPGLLGSATTGIIPWLCKINTYTLTMAMYEKNSTAYDKLSVDWSH